MSQTSSTLQNAQSFPFLGNDLTYQNFLAQLADQLRIERETFFQIFRKQQQQFFEKLFQRILRSQRSIRSSASTESVISLEEQHERHKLRKEWNDKISKKNDAYNKQTIDSVLFQTLFPRFFSALEIIGKSVLFEKNKKQNNTKIESTSNYTEQEQKEGRQLFFDEQVTEVIVDKFSPRALIQLQTLFGNFFSDSNLSKLKIRQSNLFGQQQQKEKGWSNIIQDLIVNSFLFKTLFGGREGRMGGGGRFARGLFFLSQFFKTTTGLFFLWEGLFSSQGPWTNLYKILGRLFFESSKFARFLDKKASQFLSFFSNKGIDFFGFLSRTFSQFSKFTQFLSEKIFHLLNSTFKVDLIPKIGQQIMSFFNKGINLFKFFTDKLSIITKPISNFLKLGENLFKPFLNAISFFGQNASSKLNIFSKVGSSFLGKNALKVIGKALVKIPIVGVVISLAFAIQRFRRGDVFGGILDLLSGIASCFPGVGTVISFAIDGINLMRDFMTNSSSPEFEKKQEKEAQKVIATTKQQGRAFWDQIVNSFKSIPEKLLNAIPFLRFIVDAFRKGKDVISNLIRLIFGIDISSLFNFLGLNLKVQNLKQNQTQTNWGNFSNSNQSLIGNFKNNFAETKTSDDFPLLRKASNFSAPENQIFKDSFSYISSIPQQTQKRREENVSIPIQPIVETTPISGGESTFLNMSNLLRQIDLSIKQNVFFLQSIYAILATKYPQFFDLFCRTMQKSSESGAFPTRVANHNIEQGQTKLLIQTPQSHSNTIYYNSVGEQLAHFFRDMHLQTTV